MGRPMGGPRAKWVAEGSALGYPSSATPLCGCCPRPAEGIALSYPVAHPCSSFYHVRTIAPVYQVRTIAPVAFFTCLMIRLRSLAASFSLSALLGDW